MKGLLRPGSEALRSVWPTLSRYIRLMICSEKKKSRNLFLARDSKSQFGRVKFLECTRLIQSEVS